MINRVILVGRLTKDPELRKTPNGASVLTYTIACNRRSQQPGQPDADFIQCVAWNKQADLMAQYLHKGSLIGVDGRIQTRNYDNQQGQRVYVTEVITDSVQFLEPKNSQSNNNYNQGGYQQNNNFQNNSYQGNSYQNSYGSNTNVPQQDTGFESSFDSGDSLDIASDDLPF